jgi:hypothetical protein
MRPATPRRARPVVTTFIFRVRNVPAALYKALGGFATNSVNMTKLDRYQLDGRFVATMFYADVEGHPDDPHGPRPGGAQLFPNRGPCPRRVSGKPISRGGEPLRRGRVARKPAGVAFHRRLWDRLGVP